MGFLSDFDEDVFISYAHNDDDIYAQESLGWVTRLHQDLENRVRNYLGCNIQLCATVKFVTTTNLPINSPTIGQNRDLSFGAQSELSSKRMVWAGSRRVRRPRGKKHGGPR